MHIPLLPMKNVLLLMTAAVFLNGCTTPSAQPIPGSAAAKARTNAARQAAAEAEENYPAFEERTAKLKLGMSKARVAAIMDDEGRSVSKTLSPQGAMETVVYTPDFGQRYSTALRRQFSLGFAGMSDPNGAVLTFKNGALFSISSHKQEKPITAGAAAPGRPPSASGWSHPPG